MPTPNEPNSKNAQIVMNDFSVHFIDRLLDFNLNINEGIIIARGESVELGVSIDRVRFFEFEKSRSQDVKQKICKVELAGSDNGREPELITIPEVIQHDWNPNSGLFVVVGKEITKGFHLDNIIKMEMK